MSLIRFTEKVEDQKKGSGAYIYLTGEKMVSINGKGGEVLITEAEFNHAAKSYLTRFGWILPSIDVV